MEKSVVGLFLCMLITVMSVRGQEKAPNLTDDKGLKQGAWYTLTPARYGEPACIDSGAYKDGLKDGTWLKINKFGDTLARENYSFGLKDGKNYYYTSSGLIREESWVVHKPSQLYDTVRVYLLQNNDEFTQERVRSNIYNYRQGLWTYWDPAKGALLYRETYDKDVLVATKQDPNAAPSDDPRNANLLDKDSTYVNSQNKVLRKPKEVLEFEKKNKNKKHQERTGETGL